MDVQVKKNVKITLNVPDPAILIQLGQAGVNAQCYLSDDNSGKSPDGTVQDFTSNVYTTKKVTWDGDTPNKAFSIAITKIVYEDKGTDVNFFDSLTLWGSGGKNGKVKDKEVMDIPALDGKIDVYKIWFQVYIGDNAETVELYIDPKLQGHS